MSQAQTQHHIHLKPKDHADLMDGLRHVLSQTMDEHHLSASGWSLKAGKSRNFLTEFLSGRAHDMTIGALHSLALVINTDAHSLIEQAAKA